MTEPRIAPNSIEAEEAVLGSIMINPDALHIVSGFLRGSDFFIVRNGLLYDLLLDMDSRDEAIDELTVRSEVKRLNMVERIGGLVYLSELINAAPTPRNIYVYAAMVERTAVRRRILDAASQIAGVALSDGIAVDEVVDQAEQALRNATNRVSDAQMINGSQLLSENLEEYLYWYGNPADMRGLSTGIASLDKQLGGMEPELYSIGGATSMGKSTLAMQMMLTFARQGPGIAALTETSPRVAYHKMAGDLAGVPFKILKSGRLSAEQHKAVLDAYEVLRSVSHNINVFDNSSPSLTAFRTQIHRIKNLSWVVCDSGSKLAGGIQATGESLREATNRAADFLQDVSRRIPVVATWQFGRNAKDRMTKVPQLNDFKESGAIEENSGVCIGIYRHDYYVARGEAKPDITYPKGTARLLTLKDRMGTSGDEYVDVGFQPGRGFFEIDKRREPTNGFIPSPREHANPDHF